MIFSIWFWESLDRSFCGWVDVWRFCSCDEHILPYGALSTINWFHADRDCNEVFGGPALDSGAAATLIPLPQFNPKRRISWQSDAINCLSWSLGTDLNSSYSTWPGWCISRVVALLHLLHLHLSQHLVWHPNLRNRPVLRMLQYNRLLCPTEVDGPSTNWSTRADYF